MKRINIGAANVLYPSLTTIVGVDVEARPNWITIAHVGILNHASGDIPGYLSIGLHSIMIQLGEYSCIIFMNFPSQLLETFYYIRLKCVHKLIISMVSGVNGQLLGGNQPTTPFCPLPVVIDMAVAYLMIFTEVGHMRCKVNAIWHDSGAYH